MIKSYYHKSTLDFSVEDTRTSIAIGTLLYLPDNKVWDILRSSCFHGLLLPDSVGKLLDSQFWPHWKATVTSNVLYVEPDVFLRFENLDVIIEVKRSDFGGQDPDHQWINEITSYLYQYGSEKHVVLIAMGGNENSEGCVELKVEGFSRFIRAFRSSWYKFRLSVYEASCNTSFRHEKQILDDIIEACDIFGFRSFKWFDELEWNNVEISCLNDKPFNVRSND